MSSLDDSLSSLSMRCIKNSMVSSIFAPPRILAYDFFYFFFQFGNISEVPTDFLQRVWKILQKLLQKYLQELLYNIRADSGTPLVFSTEFGNSFNSYSEKSFGKFIRIFRDNCSRRFYETFSRSSFGNSCQSFLGYSSTIILQQSSVSS